MNQYNVKYLAKILCLKTEIARDPYAVISRNVISRYTTEIEYNDLVTLITVRHKIDSMKTVFQVFNESSVNYTPIDDDYGEPIIITSFLQKGHNRFPVNFLYIDMVISDLFPSFVRLDATETNVVNSVLQTGDGKKTLRLPKMLETEIVVKILYRPNMPLKIVRFFRNNMVTGIEIADRSVIPVAE
ncbi:RNA polymerase [Volepox virus]|uniref:DNA-directed RNA polymerase subunit n=1 Tax=Volepox virus TaxID=28874 RepID=A0A1C9KC95_9POXV|nr:RNA polymerase [Volepox virus]AOP31785.1 RNA polymerase [Volepox virus]